MGQITPDEFAEIAANHRRHGPLRSVEVKLSGQRKATRAVRKRWDAAFWEGLAPEQEDAAERIVKGYNLITSGSAVSCSNPERVGHAGQVQDKPGDAALIRAYYTWARAYQRDWRLYWFLRVLAGGETCNAVDTARRKRRGTTRLELSRALADYRG